MKNVKILIAVFFSMLILANNALASKSHRKKANKKHAAYQEFQNTYCNAGGKHMYDTFYLKVIHDIQDKDQKNLILKEICEDNMQCRISISKSMNYAYKLCSDISTTLRYCNVKGDDYNYDQCDVGGDDYTANSVGQLSIYYKGNDYLEKTKEVLKSHGLVQ